MYEVTYSGTGQTHGGFVGRAVLLPKSKAGFGLVQEMNGKGVFPFFCFLLFSFPGVRISASDTR